MFKQQQVSLSCFHSAVIWKKKQKRPFTDYEDVTTSDPEVVSVQRHSAFLFCLICCDVCVCVSLLLSLNVFGSDLEHAARLVAGAINEAERLHIESNERSG